MTRWFPRPAGTRLLGRSSASIPTLAPWSCRISRRDDWRRAPAYLIGGLCWSGGRRRFRQRLVLLLRPRGIVGHDGHDRDAGDADEDLGEQRARAHHQFEMTDEGQEHTDAENGE